MTAGWYCLVAGAMKTWNINLLAVLFVFLTNEVKLNQSTEKKVMQETKTSRPNTKSIYFQESSSYSRLATGDQTILDNPSFTKLPSALQGLLAKAYGGRPLTMITVGGSNSAGGGVKKANQMFYNLFTDWWNKNIYKKTGSKLTSYKMAIGGTGSDFFAFCFQNFLPKIQPDIVLVELAINDYGYKYGEAAKPMELLTRRLLSLPSKPLVIYINLVDRSLYGEKITNPDCLNMEDLGYAKLAEHYGVLSFSWRDFVCPLTKSGKRQKMKIKPNMFSFDGLHVGFKAHAQVISLVIKYLKKIFSQYSNSTKIPARIQPKRAKSDSPFLAEPLFLDPSFNDFHLANSLCLTYLTPNWEIPLNQTLSFKVTKSKRFHYITEEESKQDAKWHTAIRSDAYSGYLAKPGKKHLQARFSVPKLIIPSKTARQTSLRSVMVIFRMIHKTTSVKMWLDELPKTLVKFSTKKCGNRWSQTRLYPLATDVPPGNYTLNIVSNVGKNFEVSGFVVSYPGFHSFSHYKPFDVKARVWSEKDYQKQRCKS